MKIQEQINQLLETFLVRNTEITEEQEIQLKDLYIQLLKERSNSLAAFNNSLHGNEDVYSFLIYRIELEIYENKTTMLLTGNEQPIFRVEITEDVGVAIRLRKMMEKQLNDPATPLAEFLTTQINPFAAMLTSEEEQKLQELYLAYIKAQLDAHASGNAEFPFSASIQVSDESECTIELRCKNLDDDEYQFNVLKNGVEISSMYATDLMVPLLSPKEESETPMVTNELLLERIDRLEATIKQFMQAHSEQARRNWFNSQQPPAQERLHNRQIEMGHRNPGEGANHQYGWPYENVNIRPQFRMGPNGGQGTYAERGFEPNPNQPMNEQYLGYGPRNPDQPTHFPQPHRADMSVQPFGYGKTGYPQSSQQYRTVPPEVQSETTRTLNDGLNLERFRNGSVHATVRKPEGSGFLYLDGVVATKVCIAVPPTGFFPNWYFVFTNNELFLNELRKTLTADGYTLDYTMDVVQRVLNQGDAEFCYNQTSEAVNAFSRFSKMLVGESVNASIIRIA